MFRGSLFIATLTLVSACRSSTPAPRSAPTAPTPEAKAEAPEAPAPSAPPTPEPPPPQQPPIATAPPPAAAGTPAAHVAAALRVLPASADVLVGLSIPRLGASVLGEKFTAMLFAARDNLPAACQTLAATDYGDVTVAFGGGAIVGVSTGKLTEKRMATCLQAILKAKGGDIASKKIAGRKVYYAVGSAEDNGWVAWTKQGVPLLANSEAGITAALDPRSPKVDADLVALANRADHSHAAWFAGRVSASKLAELGVPPGVVSGDVRFYGWLDHAADLQLDAVVTLATPADATKLEAQLRQLLEPVRQLPDAATMLRGLGIGAHGNDVHVVLALDAATTAALLAQLKFTPS
ncbi:MAG: hypothetical protein JNK64_34685 [Myxococcales bacterium]|nr:hypothetical protein [Myxococcales bacterium]